MSQPVIEEEAHNGTTSLTSGITRPSWMEWICLLAGVFLVIHYAWFMDDAFVYFRYVDNLLFLDYGLVYNAGEYVEGFSSPLWTLLLIPLRSTGLGYWFITRMVGVISFAIFWWLAVLANRRMSPGHAAIINFPLCYLTFCYGLLCYFTSGLESPLVHVSAVLYVLFAINPKSRSLKIVLALTPLLRHELALPFLLCAAWFWYSQRRFPWMMIAASVLFVGSWLLFRVYYYADLLPNTFYLKDTVDVSQGLTYLWDTVGTYFLVLFLILMVSLAVACRVLAKKPDVSNPAGDESTGDGTEVTAGCDMATRLFILLLAASITAYVVKIGGDPRHYRYLAFPFCLTVMAFGGIGESLWMRTLAPRFRRSAAGIGLLVAIPTAMLYPQQLSGHPFLGAEKHTTVKKINDASVHRHDKTLSQPPWGVAHNLELTDKYDDFLGDNPNGQYIGLGGGFWCSEIYQHFNVRYVHVLGLTDPILARTEMPADRPAHKFGLMQLAGDIGVVINEFGEPDRGMYRWAVEKGLAAPWIAANLDKIEIIERKAYNKHDFFENLGLAFTRVGKIDPSKGMP